jgi:hypothetical protein
MNNQATIDRLKRKIRDLEGERDRTLDPHNRAYFESEIAVRSIVLKAEEERKAAS